MRERNVEMGATLGLALILLVWIFLVWGNSGEMTDVVSHVTGTTPDMGAVDKLSQHFVPVETPMKRVKKTKGPGPTGAAVPNEPGGPVVTVQYPEGLEGIKQQLYDINVEYIEDLDALEAMGHVTDQPPEVLWQGEWASADDWKRRGDGFRIEQREDGSFAFFPDSDSSQSYAWDEEKGEFAWELDYYGKIITHKARFIDEDVLVLMKISGRKVALDIYSKAE